MKTKLKHDHNTGEFIWLISTGRIRADDVAGYPRKDGYRRIKIDGKLYKAHRLAWLFVYGVWPVNQIDHINGKRDDNRIANLREATPAENQQNRVKQRDNTSGYTGVNWHKLSGKYLARIQVNGKDKHLGFFDDKEEARQAYLATKAKYHQFNPVQR